MLFVLPVQMEMPCSITFHVQLPSSVPRHRRWVRVVNGNNSTPTPNDIRYLLVQPITKFTIVQRRGGRDAREINGHCLGGALAHGGSAQAKQQRRRTRAMSPLRCRCPRERGTAARAATRARALRARKDAMRCCFAQRACSRSARRVYDARGA